MTGRLADGVLVIGYGNPLRGDDGAGVRAATLLAEDPRAHGAEVLACHQLTPELADEVARAELLVLIDAAVSPAPAGSVATRALSPSPADRSAFTHHVGSSGLLDLASRLFGHAPPAIEVTVSAQDLDFSTALSAPVCEAMPAIVDAVIEEIGRFRDGWRPACDVAARIGEPAR